MSGDHAPSETALSETAPSETAPSETSWLPQTIVLLGTDAAGKNHVARVWIERMRALGLSPIMQEGWLSNDAADLDAEEEKSFLSHLAERIFLRVFPLIGWAMPPILNLLLLRDLRRFPADDTRRLVVSHSALRILAFCLGARGRSIEELPSSSRRAVRKFHRQSGALFIVLDVDHHVRRQRIEARVAEDDSDPFDRYMLASGSRSERIEECLVELATEYMGAHLIVNNALDDEALWSELKIACQKSTGRGLDLD